VFILTLIGVLVCNNAYSQSLDTKSVESELKAIVASEQIPPDLIITYSFEGHWIGAETITLSGDGVVKRLLEYRNAPKEPIVSKIKKQDFLDLIKFLIEIRAWKQVETKLGTLYQTGGTYIMLKISIHGQKSDIWLAQELNQSQKSDILHLNENNNRITKIEAAFEALKKKLLEK
jgi:hypothetical protein